MYGIEESKRDKHQYFLDVCRKEFEHCYALNVISVNEQYGDNREPETGSFDEEFEEHRQMAQRIYKNDMFGNQQPVNMRQLRARLHSFFQSVLYQIEDDVCHRTAAAWFYACLTKLHENEVDSVTGWWGEIELKQELENFKKSA